ncbi:class I SAM-dependent methyltransferase [Photorhabdus australis]
MNTLTTHPLSTILEKLFSESDNSQARLFQTLGYLPETEQQALMKEAGGENYKIFYTRAKDHYMSISRDTGNLLYILCRANSSRSVIEFGTSFGISTLHLAAAVKDNGGGKVISTEFEHKKVVQARINMEKAGVEHLVEIREGDAIETLGQNLPEKIDFILLDGAKTLYHPILMMLEDRMHTGTLIVADNAEWAPEYCHYVRISDNYVSVPFAKDIELSIRL